MDNDSGAKYKVVGLLLQRDEPVVRVDLGTFHALLLWRNMADWLLSKVKRA